MLWYAEFGSAFFKSYFFLGCVAEPVFVPVMYLNMIKHSVFNIVTCSLVIHSSYLLLCTISGICICICIYTYDLAMWVWQSQLCIVNSFLMWVQSQTRSFSGKRPAAAALQLAIAILRTFIVEMFPIVVEVA